MSRKRRRLRPRWRIVVPAAVVLLLVIALLVWLLGGVVSFVGSLSDKRNNLFCSSKSIKVVNKLVDHTYTSGEQIGDSFFYGESLVLSSQIYNHIGKYNSYEGKTIKLVNLCDNKEYKYEIGDKFDNHLPLGKLGPGVYALYLQVAGVDKRMYSEDKIYESLHTVKSGNSTNKVELVADRSHFKAISGEKELAENYLFLIIKRSDLPNDVYDVVIDAGFNENSGEKAPTNVIKRDHPEAETLYDLAVKLAEELRHKGYKVLVTRNSFDEVVLSYGEGGRIHRTIAAKAKYYVSLTMEKSGGLDYSGVQITHSYYSSSNFADAVYQQMQKANVGFAQKNIIPSARSLEYDMTIDLREIGGVALQAASYSDIAEEANASFAYTVYGVNGIRISLGNMDNKEDVKAMKENGNNWVKLIATGLDNYIKR